MIGDSVVIPSPIIYLAGRLVLFPFTLGIHDYTDPTNTSTESPFRLVVGDLVGHSVGTFNSQLLQQGHARAAVIDPHTTEPNRPDQLQTISVDEGESG